jgi:hypothetical protein
MKNCECSIDLRNQEGVTVTKKVQCESIPNGRRMRINGGKPNPLIESIETCQRIRESVVRPRVLETLRGEGITDISNYYYNK